MKFEACISCLRAVTLPAYMKRDKMPQILYRIIDKKLYFSFDMARWFPHVGSFRIDDIMAEDWNIYNITKNNGDFFLKSP